MQTTIRLRTMRPAMMARPCHGRTPPRMRHHVQNPMDRVVAVDVTEVDATGADLAVETGLKARVRPTLRHPSKVPMVQPQRQPHLRPL